MRNKVKIKGVWLKRNKEDMRRQINK